METKYLLPTDRLVKTQTYIKLNNAHNRNGYTLIHNPPNPIKIYTIEMVCILFEKELPVTIQGNEELILINACELFLESYVNGYIKGQEHFENNEKLSTNVLYSANAASYIKTFSSKYSKNGINNLSGWKLYKTAFPLIISKPIIERIGFYCGLVTNADIYVNEHFELFKSILDNKDVITNKPLPANKIVEPKPIFDPGIIEPLLEKLNPYFAGQQTELKQLIEKGNNATSKLLFNGAGNKLSYAFKLLIDNDLIIGVNKKELTQWVEVNFKYITNKKETHYTANTLGKTIMRGDIPSKRPLFDIEDGKIINPKFKK